MGAVLNQFDDNGEPRVIAYGHKSLFISEQKYHFLEKEAMALVWAVDHFKQYLYGKHFELITDHQPLEFIFKLKSKPAARVERKISKVKFQVLGYPGIFVEFSILDYPGSSVE